MIRVPGKWILAGEHAVLRGATALAFPLRSRWLELLHDPADHPLYLDVAGVEAPALRASAMAAVRRAVELLDLPFEVLRGTLRLVNRVPCGAGLGASATLCVALARWLADRGLLPVARLHAFARELENLFHGTSSGLDVAVALQEQALLFTAQDGVTAFAPAWTPLLYVSDSGARAGTAACVGKVRALFERAPSLGACLDDDMRRAVWQCVAALESHGRSALQDLAEGMTLASRCFRAWDLVESALARHLEELQAAGARAAKPTGAGGGGFVLSLWEKPPEGPLGERLIPCF